MNSPLTRPLHQPICVRHMKWNATFTRSDERILAARRISWAFSSVGLFVGEMDSGSIFLWKCEPKSPFVKRSCAESLPPSPRFSSLFVMGETSKSVNGLIHRYYPQILTVADKVARPWFLDLWELAPTPAKARRIRRPRLVRFLNEHHIRTVSAEELWELFRQPTVTVSQGTTDAACAHIRLAIERLRVVNRQQTECQKRLDTLCSALVPEPTSEDIPENRCPEHHDVEILRSLPGIGRIVLAMVLGEAWWAIQARDYEVLRTLSGIAPVTRASGKSRKVIMRRACNPRLREAMYHWTRIAVQKDAASRQRYTALRARGHSHGRALRTVGDRLLSVACAMLRNGSLYDSEHRGFAAAAEAC